MVLPRFGIHHDQSASPSHHANINDENSHPQIYAVLKDREAAIDKYNAGKAACIAENR